MGVKVREWKGAWWLFVDHQGRRKAKRVGTGTAGRKAANTAAEKIAAKLALGDLSVMEPEPVKTPPTSFATLYEDWLQKYPALHAIRHGTLVGYRSFAEQHLVPFFGQKAVTVITSRLIEDFIEAKRAPGGSVRRVGKPLADGSLRTGLLTLRLILQRGVRLGLIPANPMNDVEWRGMPHMEQVDPFAGRELRAILAAAERLQPEFATLLRLWMQSGMRAGEVAGLQWQDVDLTTGLVKVRRTWSRQRLGQRRRVSSVTCPCCTRLRTTRRNGAQGSQKPPRAHFIACGDSRCGPSSQRRFCSSAAVSRSLRWLCTARGAVCFWRHRFATAHLSSYGTRSPARCSRAMRPYSTSSSKAAGGLRRSCSGSTRGGCHNLPQPWRNRCPSTMRRRGAGMLANYLMTQNPCASMPRATLNFERKFSSAIAAVSSTICGSE